MQQSAELVGVEITYYEKAPVIVDCASETEAREMVQAIEAAMSNGQAEIELDDFVKVGLDNVRSVGLASRQG